MRDTSRTEHSRRLRFRRRGWRFSAEELAKDEVVVRVRSDFSKFVVHSKKLEQDWVWLKVCEILSLLTFTFQYKIEVFLP